MESLHSPIDTLLPAAKLEEKNNNSPQELATRILDLKGLMTAGRWVLGKPQEEWELYKSTSMKDGLEEAARLLRESDTPVGFPTETVYGLGADATRSEAVKGIYKAKGRPSDNPLIIHVSDLKMLRNIMLPKGEVWKEGDEDPIPDIYKPLIKKFWPGPLTILMPNPANSKLAPEVTAGLPTFGVRMPNLALALTLIKLSEVPLAAPSANASTKPSPTSAAHVYHDLKGRIELIIDGGDCKVGVESTVIDGLNYPPSILRPGGVSKEEIKAFGGEAWKNVVVAYKDASEEGTKAPRAPGMKYKHYSPKATVILYEDSSKTINPNSGHPDHNPDTHRGISSEPYAILSAIDNGATHLGFEDKQLPLKIGFITTKDWDKFAQFEDPHWLQADRAGAFGFHLKKSSSVGEAMPTAELWEGSIRKPGRKVADLVAVNLGGDTKLVARGLFGALRALDGEGVNVIYVEGIKDKGEVSAAVMNRLRKAATVIITEEEVNAPWKWWA